MTSIHPERRAGTSVCSWNILYFSVPHKSTTAVTNPHGMPLTDSLLALQRDVQSETLTPAQVQALYSIWLDAQKRMFASQIGEIQRLGEAEIAQKVAQALAAIEVQQVDSVRLAREAMASAIRATPATSSAGPEPLSIPDSTPLALFDVASGVTEPPVPEHANALAPQREVPNRTAADTPRSIAPAAPLQPPPALGAKSVNARYAGLKVGLNDRVAFVKHLFNGEDDDFQRVVAALATMESKQECETFLENAVYGDYDWSQKPEISERFLALVFARFE